MADLKEFLEPHYNEIKRKVIWQANGLPGACAMMMKNIRQNAPFGIDKIYEGLFLDAVISTRRNVEIERFMIVFPVMGFAISFCMAKNDVGVARTAITILLAGVFLGIYRILVWKGRE
jgi:hypothetical protein